MAPSECPACFGKANFCQACFTFPLNRSCLLFPSCCSECVSKQRSGLKRQQQQLAAAIHKDELQHGSLRKPASSPRPTSFPCTCAPRCTYQHTMRRPCIPSCSMFSLTRAQPPVLAVALAARLSLPSPSCPSHFLLPRPCTPPQTQQPHCHAECYKRGRGTRGRIHSGQADQGLRAHTRPARSIAALAPSLTTAASASGGDSSFSRCRASTSGTGGAPSTSRCSSRIARTACRTCRGAGDQGGGGSAVERHGWCAKHAAGLGMHRCLLKTAPPQSMPHEDPTKSPHLRRHICQPLLPQRAQLLITDVGQGILQACRHRCAQRPGCRRCRCAQQPKAGPQGWGEQRGAGAVRWRQPTQLCRMQLLPAQNTGLRPGERAEGLAGDYITVPAALTDFTTTTCVLLPTCLSHRSWKAARSGRRPSTCCCPR